MHTNQQQPASDVAKDLAAIDSALESTPVEAWKRARAAPGGADEADRRYAAYWDGRSRVTLVSGCRDTALLCGVQALRIAPTDDRRRWLNHLIGSDYGALKASVRLENSVEKLDLSPDGKLLLIYEMGCPTRLWRMDTLTPCGQPIPDTADAIAFSADSKTLVMAGRWGPAQVWDAYTGAPIGEPMLHEGKVKAVAFSPDGKIVLTVGEDHKARLWRAGIGEAIGKPLKLKSDVVAAAICADGKTMRICCDNNTVSTWSMETGKLLRQLELPSGIESISPAGDVVTIVDDDTGIRNLCHADTGKHFVGGQRDVSWMGANLRDWLPEQRHIVTLTLSADCKTAATSCNMSNYDYQVARLWSVEAITRKRYTNHAQKTQSQITGMTFSPAGKHAVTVCDDGSAQLWQFDAETAIAREIWHKTEVDSAEFSSNAEKMITVSSTAAQLWDVNTGEPIGKPFKRARESNSDFTLSSDGNVVVRASWEPDVVRAWNAITGKPVGKPAPYQATRLGFSPDSKTVAICRTGGYVTFWDLAAGKAICEFDHGDYDLINETYGDEVGAIAFSPDGRTLATASEVLRLWQVDLAAQKVVSQGKPLRHRGGIRSVAFSPDGMTLFTITDSVVAGYVLSHQGHGLSVQLAHVGLLDREYLQGGHVFVNGTLRIAYPSQDGPWAIKDPFNYAQFEPVQGDTGALMDEWQTKLGLTLKGTS